jgi:hypothetical protein
MGLLAVEKLDGMFFGLIVLWSKTIYPRAGGELEDEEDTLNT